MRKYLTENEIKAELVKMLKFFDEYCSQYGISYSIMSGTMLGAIRNDGFIPWDDDIDVGLLRPEYEKLIKTIKDNDCHDAIEKYFFVGHEVNESNKPYIKLLNKRIMVDGKDTADRFLWIDIFPFDGMPRNCKKIYRLFFKKFLRRARDFKIDNLYNTIRKNQRNLLKKIYCSLVYFLFKNKSLNDVNSLLIHKAKSLTVDSSDYVQDIVWGTKSIPRYLFDDLVDYQFENITVKGFKDYDTYLTCIYGDYMKLPPEDQRVNHGIKAWRIDSDEE